MKKRKILFALLISVLAALVVFCSCSNTNGDDTFDTGSDSVSVSGDDTGAASDIEGVTVVEKDSVSIHSISQLNSESEGIDSHAGMEAYSTLELNNREYNMLSSLELGVTVPYYPRVRQMENGKYIMTYQANRIPWEVFVAFSEDGVRWKNSRKLLGTCEYPNGYADTMVFMTADLCVLDDGTIIVVSAFRGKANYAKDVNSNGLVIIKSTDNGATWSEKQIIYTGTCWEPYIMQTSSGEIQVYFTQTGHLLAEHGWSTDRRSSCVGLLRSNDGGDTWTKQTGYSAQIVMQQFVYHKNGYDYMNDQMPVAIELHNGTIVLAAEGYLADDTYDISIAYSKDNWATSLGFNESGPASRITNFLSGAGPYLAQFESGETVLSTHTSQMHTYVGTAEAKNFTNHYQPFKGHIGNWSSLYVDSTHSIIGTMAYETAGETNDPSSSVIDVGRMYLNHVIYAKKSDITVDGKTEDWDNNTSALFIGSDTQAQMSMRFSYDDEKVYYLFERLDNYLTDGDVEGFYLPVDADTYYLIKFGTVGVDSVKYYNGKKLSNAEIEGMEWAITLVGNTGDTEKDTGKILEISIPRSAVSVSDDGLLLFNAMLYNKDKSEKAVNDTFSCADTSNRNTWQRVYLTK